MNKSLLVLLTFVVVSADVFHTLAGKLTDWEWFSKFPALVGAFLGSVAVGATIAHILLSFLSGTNMRRDIVQAEPVEELVQ